MIWMADKEKEKQDAPAEPPPAADKGGGDAATATAKPKRKSKPAPKKRPPGLMPQWKVLLHNDDVNSFEYVITSITSLTPLNEEEAILRTQEADKSGLALLLTTHKERAELYQEQFTSKGLTVTIEPTE
jgi:ATP-dependent Clp protease adaptor protein ClpS